jgi:hypothetical protein
MLTTSIFLRNQCISHCTWCIEKDASKIMCMCFSQPTVHSTTGHAGHKGSRGIFTLSLTSTLYGVGWSTLGPCRLIPREQTRYHLYRRLGGFRDRSGRVRKCRLPPGFDPKQPSRGESPYRLPCPGPQNYTYTNNFFIFHYVYLISWCPHLGQILRQLLGAHNRLSRLCFDQCTPLRTKRFGNILCTWFPSDICHI